jgi:hypothetical protein
MKRALLFSAAICLAWSGHAMAQQQGGYVVLFPFDKSTLDATARATISSAAEEFKRTGSAHISVQGNTDTSGASDYNQALSERREQAVTNELVRLGVPATAISGVALGETQPAVPTGDNVREAQNRRVDIQIEAPPPPPPAPAPVAETPPPPPPPPPEPEEKLWSFSPGLFYGYNFHDQQATHSQLVGINLSLDYHPIDWASIGVEQAGFYHFETDDDGPGGRTVIGPDFYLGDMFYVGGNFGYLYGDGFHDDFIAGPEAGVRWEFIDWKVAYDIPFNRDAGDGILNTTIGTTFRF